MTTKVVDTNVMNDIQESILDISLFYHNEGTSISAEELKKSINQYVDKLKNEGLLE